MMRWNFPEKPEFNQAKEKEITRFYCVGQRNFNLGGRKNFGQDIVIYYE